MQLVAFQFIPRCITKRLADTLNAKMSRETGRTMERVGAVGSLLSILLLVCTTVIIIMNNSLLTLMSIVGVFASLIGTIISSHIFSIGEGFAQGKKLYEFQGGWWRMDNASLS